jgi:hypothetical protein
MIAPIQAQVKTIVVVTIALRVLLPGSGIPAMVKTPPSTISAMGHS